MPGGAGQLVRPCPSGFVFCLPLGQPDGKGQAGQGWQDGVARQNGVHFALKRRFLAQAVFMLAMTHARNDGCSSISGMFPVRALPWSFPIQA